MLKFILFYNTIKEWIAWIVVEVTMNKKLLSSLRAALVLGVGIVFGLSLVVPFSATAAQDGGLDPLPPDAPVRLIFIHHSTGENWLRDGYGNLGRTLGENNYFVSDTNYGWGPYGIGDSTDIVNWPKWFGPERDDQVLAALYGETEQNSEYSRLLPNPGGENEIILFKSCFPNSELRGNPDDLPASSGYDYTVGSAKLVYNELLDYFASRQDKLFVVITAPPLSDGTYADNARAFNNWLVGEWLNDYPFQNVAVFDFYNVLTAPGNHHWFSGGQIEHIVDQGGNTSHYASSHGDDHPNAAGSQKATDEFIPLLNIFYHRWQASGPPSGPAPEAAAEGDASSGDAPAPPMVEPAPGSAAGSGNAEDGFEYSENDWFSSWDETEGTEITCLPDSTQVLNGAVSLQIQFAVNAGGWADCGRDFEPMQDWSANQGVRFHLHADTSDQPMVLMLFTTEAYFPYVVHVDVHSECATSWEPYFFTWDQFEKPEWAGPEGPNEIDPTQIMSMGLVLEAEADNSGTIWLDQLEPANEPGAPGLCGPPPASASNSGSGEAPSEDTSSSAAEDSQGDDSSQGESPQGDEEGGLRSMCPLTPAITIGALAATVFMGRRRKEWER